MYALKAKKHYVTLIEMMIVMFLIALIIGVVGYNYRGTLEEGKAFKTRAAIDKVTTILNLAVAENPNLQNDIESNWQGIVQRSPLVSDANALTHDGWGETYQVTVEEGKITVRSRRLDEYAKTSSSGG